MAQNRELRYSNKQKDEEIILFLKWANAEPSPNDHYARSMDAVQRL